MDETLIQHVIDIKEQLATLSANVENVQDTLKYQTENFKQSELKIVNLEVRVASNEAASQSALKTVRIATGVLASLMAIFAFFQKYSPGSH